MISFQYYKGLPVEYESFLISRYDSFITTCHYIAVYYPDYDINYALVYKNNQLIELLVFGNKKNISICFNSLAYIDQQVISEFAKGIFAEYPTIQKIKIEASYQSYHLNKSILFFNSDDHILYLPATMDEYYSKLGRSTRQHIKNRKVRLLRDYPTTRFITKFGVEIDENVVDRIIQLNVDRMKSKGTIPGIDNVYKNKIFNYSQHYGCAAYIEIDGKIVAGTISSIINKGIFGHVTAYDIEFNKYSIGEICAFFIIETAIEKQLSTFHFLWGESDMKKRLLGKHYPLFSYFIYRSYSLNFIANNIKTILCRTLMNIKRSKLSKPVRDLTKRMIKRFQLSN
jgi:Protein involved in cellulose biosynthesis (CelD)